MKSTPASALLTQAFEHRWMQRLEECLFALAQIKPLAEAGVLTPQETVDYLCLQASMARAGGDRLSAQELLDQAQTYSQHAQSFYFQINKALNLTARGQFNNALQIFLYSLSLCTSQPTHQAIALFNAVICLQNLGLHYQQTLDRFLDVLAQVKQNKSHFQLAHYFEQQYLTFTARTDLHRGDFKTLLSALDFPRDGQALNQKDYLKAWAAQLPYHQYHTKAGPLLLESVLTRRLEMYQSEYRRRTLQGRVTAADLNTAVSPSDAADRLYLLVWNWLKNPQANTLQKVVQTLKSLNLQSSKSRLTQEDQQLVHNSLLWLQLLAPAEMGFSELIQLFEAGSPAQAPLFAFERKCIEILQAHKDGQDWIIEDCLLELQESPLWNQPDVTLSALVKTVIRGETFSGPLEQLVGVLMGSVQPQSFQKPTVNLLLGQVCVSDKIVHSEALAKSLDLLARKSVVSIPEFLQVAFGISRYEPTIHAAKVFNLVSRIKALDLTPKIKIGVKSQKVWTEADWSQFEWIRSNAYSETLKSAGQVLKINSKQAVASGSNLSQNHLHFKAGQVLTRMQLETRLDRPRSTVNRLLANWEAQGKIKKLGIGRSTRYQILNAEEIL